MGRAVEVVQVWRCERCGFEYKAPIVINECTCSNRHPRIKMKLVSGEAPKPRVTKPAPPKVGRNLIQEHLAPKPKKPGVKLVPRRKQR